MERSLLQGDTEGGITYMRMDEGLDTGPIMKSLPCPISLEENYESLEKKYQNLSKNELIKFLDDLADGRVREARQDSERACYAEKIEKKETEIFWKAESEEFINRKIRALFPKYGAFTFMGDKRVKILSCCKAYISQQLSPGEIYVSEGEYLYAGCLDNKVLKIQLIQPEGKRAITGEDFIKGNREKISQIKKFSSSLEK